MNGTLSAYWVGGWPVIMGGQQSWGVGPDQRPGMQVLGRCVWIVGAFADCGKINWGFVSFVWH